MALRSALVLLAAAVAAAAAEDGNGGFVPFPIVHSTNSVFKRAVELSLPRRSDIAYYAKLNFGTPAQPQYVQVDTGSFELWVNPTCTGLATGDSSFCSRVGHYTAADSTSATRSSAGSKVLQYGIGSANITYVNDDIALPGTSTTLRSVQFGVATVTDDEFSGILGLGYGLGLTTRYRNFVDELAAQNATRVKAFSLALGSKAEQAGVLLFGGVDTRKFAGALARLPIVPAADSPDGVPRYWVAMASLSLTTTGSSSSSSSSTTATKTYASSAMDVFFDSGSTLSLLPNALVDAIAADLDADGPDASGFYYVDCAVAQAAGSLDFAFAGATIHVPFDELIRQSGDQCMLGLQGSDDFALLGDTFMRSAYVVIDQTDNVVWLAPYANCGDAPAAIADASALADLTGECADPSTNRTESSASSSAASPSPSSSSATASASSAGKAFPSSATRTATATKTTSPSTATASSSSSSSPTAASSSSSGAAPLSGRPWSAAGMAVAACVAALGLRSLVEQLA